MSPLKAAASMLRGGRVTSSLMRFAFAVFPLCILLSCSDVQTQVGHEKTALAVVKGRVFLITRGGDLKPARLARVYLASTNALPDAQETKKWASAVREDCSNIEYSRRGPEPIAQKAVEFWSSQYNNAFSELLNLFEAKHKSDGMFAVDADEDGTFLFAAVPAGSYLIVAFGQAGVNLGYWQVALSVTTGDQPQVKLSSPVTACTIV